MNRRTRLKKRLPQVNFYSNFNPSRCCTWPLFSRSLCKLLTPPRNFNCWHGHENAIFPPKIGQKSSSIQYERNVKKKKCVCYYLKPTPPCHKIVNRMAASCYQEAISKMQSISSQRTPFCVLWPRFKGSTEATRWDRNSGTHIILMFVFLYIYTYLHLYQK